MQNPSTVNIYNFKGNIVNAANQVVVNYGWNHVFIERQAVKLKQAVRKEISFDLGEAMNESALADGSHVYDYFPGRLRLRIVTARRDDQPSPVQEIRDLHDLFVAQALDAFEERKAPFTVAILPYYSVKTIRPLGTKSDLDIRFLEDFTDVEFQLEFGIRSTVWP